MLYREGPIDGEARTYLHRLLPAARSMRSRLRSLLGRERLSGMVHVYVIPRERGGSVGEGLVRAASRELKRQGVTHQLTLADDNGSGKLREWYASLGFVAAAGMVGMDTSMVAHTG